MPSHRAYWSVGDLVAFAPHDFPHLDEPAVGQHWTHPLRVLDVQPAPDDTTWIYGVACMLCTPSRLVFAEVHLCDLSERPDLSVEGRARPVVGAVDATWAASDVRVGDYVRTAHTVVGHPDHRWRVVRVHNDSQAWRERQVDVRCETCETAGRVVPATRTWPVVSLTSVIREGAPPLQRRPRDPSPFIPEPILDPNPFEGDPEFTDRGRYVPREAVDPTVARVAETPGVARIEGRAPAPPLPPSPRGPKLKPGEYVVLDQNHQYIWRVTLLSGTNRAPASLLLEEITVIPYTEQKAMDVHRTHLTPETLARLVDLLGLTLPPAVKRRITLDEGEQAG